MDRSEEIRRRLGEVFRPVLLEIENDSSKHAGHAAMKGLAGGQTHYTVRIVSAAFAGKSPIERHRMVNEALKDLFDHGLHALAIKAAAPE